MVDGNLAGFRLVMTQMEGHSLCKGPVAQESS